MHAWIRHASLDDGSVSPCGVSNETLFISIVWCIICSGSSKITRMIFASQYSSFNPLDSDSVDMCQLVLGPPLAVAVSDGTQQSHRLHIAGRHDAGVV